jgi:diaminopimelate decarboxylase
VKCNPDPVVIKTLAVLGCNFDCASRNEIRLVEEATKDLPHKPDIIYANPCKARAHLIEAVCKGVKMVTFDNVIEVQKCAAVSKKIELILRIMTDDRGSQCRLSSKFGAPRYKWRPLLAAAKKNGLQVVGVSFHVGSGCRDASRYELALKDAREIFDMAEKDFGMKMKIIDIGGGFPGETHSMWNPAEEIDDEDADAIEGKEATSDEGEEEADNRFMFFSEIAAQVAPVIDQYFPPELGVRIIGEPGRYFVAACATLLCSVVSARSNELDASFDPEAINDKDASTALDEMTRVEAADLVHNRGGSTKMENDVFDTIQEELEDYSRLYASQQLAQQEFDIYSDKVDLFNEGYTSATDMLGPPDEEQMKSAHHTVEGMTYQMIASSSNLDDGAQQEPSGLLTLAAAGEAAVNGVMMQAVADSTPMQDDFAYYINDGVYGAFNNIMFDHAHIRPRVLHSGCKDDEREVRAEEANGFMKLESFGDSSEEGFKFKPRDLFASTVFGPTCDSIDVVARSVLLPRLVVGDWMYFQNMGAYTMAASSSFNGFTPSEILYVCSVQPEYFEGMIRGPADASEEEKKADV